MLTIGLNRAVVLLAEPAADRRRGPQLLRELGTHPEGGAVGLYRGRYGPIQPWRCDRLAAAGLRSGCGSRSTKPWLGSTRSAKKARENGRKPAKARWEGRTEGSSERPPSERRHRFHQGEKSRGSKEDRCREENRRVEEARCNKKGRGQKNCQNAADVAVDPQHGPKFGARTSFPRRRSCSLSSARARRPSGSARLPALSASRPAIGRRCAACFVRSKIRRGHSRRQPSPRRRPAASRSHGHRALRERRRRRAAGPSDSLATA